MFIGKDFRLGSAGEKDNFGPIRYDSNSDMECEDKYFELQFLKEESEDVSRQGSAIETNVAKKSSIMSKHSEVLSSEKRKDD